MNSILVDYFERFHSENLRKFDYFFTQLTLENYGQKLPYIYGVERFCLRLTKALLNQEKICIFSDYDTDAVTATASMYWGLIELGFDPQNLSFYSPDRFSEGYGMNVEAVAALAKENQLIISVDCGINSVAEADLILQEPNCDLIITDHHHLHGPLPKALSVVNPRLAKCFQDDCNLQTSSEINFNWQKTAPAEQILDFYDKWRSQVYISDPNQVSSDKFLSESVTGVGVAWFCVVWLGYFLQEIKQILPKINIKKPEITKLNNLLGFVGIGTVADCQSILEPTNRLLVRTGIQILSKGQYPFLGLQELMKQTGLQSKIEQNYILNSQDLGFILSPILNSSGRISHAKLSIQTLLASQADQASLLASELIATNEERKNIVRELTDNLNQLVLEQINHNHQAIWLDGNWNKGIIGLLASRFVSTHNLPCIVISHHDGLATASLRAPEGYHLVKALQNGAEFLTKFGGHPGAAGFTCLPDNLPQVKDILFKSLENQAKNILKPTKKYTQNNTDLPEFLTHLVYQPHLIWLNSPEITPKLLQNIWKLDPFGQDLPLPRLIFQLEKYTLRWLGQDHKHLKLFFENNQSVTIFNLAEEIQVNFLQNKLPIVWVEAKLTQNTWNNATKNELIAENLWII